MIQVERVEDRVWLRAAWYPGLPAKCKSVPGARWRDADKVWTYPLDIEVCRLLRTTFGQQLQIGPQLREWAVRAKADEKKLADAMDIDLTKPIVLERVPSLAPMMWEAMRARGYQPVAAMFGSIVGSHVNADQQGLGKCIESFAALIESGVTGDVLIVGPRTSLRVTWQREIIKWLSDLDGGVRYLVVDSKLGAGLKRSLAIADFLNGPSARLRFVLVNAEMCRVKPTCRDDLCNGRGMACESKHDNVPVHSSLFMRRWAAVIGDEVHRYLMHANPRSKSVSQVGLGLQTLDADLRIALSGTPMRGKPRKIWATLRWCRPDLYPSEWRWSKFYFETEADGYAYGGEKVTENLRADREAAFNRELSRLVLRRTKSELRAINPEWAPPDKMYFEAWVDLDPQQRKQYAAMEKAAEVDIGGEVLSANGILAEMTRLRQFACASGTLRSGEFFPELPSSKFDWTVEFLGRRGIIGKATEDEGDSKVVIASQFAKIINLYHRELEALGIPCFKLTGATKDVDNTAAIERFQQPGGPRVFLLTTTAGGVSVTLDAADDVVILDETWVPDDQEQVEDRVHRASDVTHQVNIYYVRAEDTVERGIAGDNEMRDVTQKRSLDGRRGVEYAKQRFGAKTTNKEDVA